MVSLTIRHRRRDALTSSLDAVLGGWRLMMRDRGWRNLKRDHGLVGYVRALDMTITERGGWHPHIHALLFLDSEPASSLEDEVAALWLDAVEASGGLRPSRKRGVVITRGSSEYVAKTADGLERRVREAARAGKELARGDLKASKAGRGGRIPFDLLHDPDSPADRARWAEYVYAIKGRRWFTFSRGLKALYGVVDDTDSEVMDAQTAGPVVLQIDSGVYWSRLLRSSVRATGLLTLVELGDHAAIRRLLPRGVIYRLRIVNGACVHAGDLWAAMPTVASLDSARYSRHDEQGGGAPPDPQAAEQAG